MKGRRVPAKAAWGQIVFPQELKRPKPHGATILWPHKTPRGKFGRAARRIPYALRRDRFCGTVYSRAAGSATGRGGYSRGRTKRGKLTNMVHPFFIRSVRCTPAVFPRWRRLTMDSRAGARMIARRRRIRKTPARIKVLGLRRGRHGEHHIASGDRGLPRPNVCPASSHHSQDYP